MQASLRAMRACSSDEGVLERYSRICSLQRKLIIFSDITSVKSSPTEGELKFSLSLSYGWKFHCEVIS